MDSKITRIFVAEDEPQHVEMLKAKLEHVHIAADLTAFPSGEELLEHLEDTRNKQEVLPDLIVLDLHLPGEYGIETLKKIKAHEAFKAIPVFINTASVERQDIVNSFRAGGTFFMNKGWDDDILQDAILQLKLNKKK